MSVLSIFRCSFCATVVPQISCGDVDKFLSDVGSREGRIRLLRHGILGVESFYQQYEVSSTVPWIISVFSRLLPTLYWSIPLSTLSSSLDLPTSATKTGMKLSRGTPSGKYLFLVEVFSNLMGMCLLSPLVSALRRIGHCTW